MVNGKLDCTYVSFFSLINQAKLFYTNVTFTHSHAGSYSAFLNIELFLHTYTFTNWWYIGVYNGKVRKSQQWVNNILNAKHAFKIALNLCEKVYACVICLSIFYLPWRAGLDIKQFLTVLNAEMTTAGMCHGGFVALIA